MNKNYEVVSNFKFIVVCIVLALIPIALTYNYLNNLQNGPIISLRNKYQMPNLEQNCKWTDVNNYNACFNRDFLKFVRNKTSYEAIMAFELLISINKHDIVKQTTKAGKIKSKLDYLESLISFFEINMTKKMRRDQVDFLNTSITYLKRGVPLSTFREAQSYFKYLDQELNESEEKETLLQRNRYKIIKNRYESMKVKLRDD